MDSLYHPGRRQKKEWSVDHRLCFRAPLKKTQAIHTAHNNRNSSFPGVSSPAHRSVALLCRVLGGRQCAWWTGTRDMQYMFGYHSSRPARAGQISSPSIDSGIERIAVHRRPTLPPALPSVRFVGLENLWERSRAHLAKMDEQLRATYRRVATWRGIDRIGAMVLYGTLFGSLALFILLDLSMSWVLFAVLCAGFLVAGADGDWWPWWGWLSVHRGDTTVEAGQGRCFRGERIDVRDVSSSVRVRLDLVLRVHLLLQDKFCVNRRLSHP